MGPPCPVTGMPKSALLGTVTPPAVAALGTVVLAASLAGATGFAALHAARAMQTMDKEARRIRARLRLHRRRWFFGISAKRHGHAQAQNQLLGAGSIETANAWLTTAVIVSPTFTWDNMAIRAGSVTSSV